MKAPPRLIDEGNQAAGLEHDLLAAARGQRMPPRDKALAWTRLAATTLVPVGPFTAPTAPQAATSPAALSAAPAAGGAVKALTTASLAKGTIVAVLLAGGAITTYRLMRHPPDERRLAPPAAVRSPAPPGPTEAPAVSAAPGTPPAPEAQAGSESGAAARIAPGGAGAGDDETPQRRPPASDLAAEVRILLQARHELRAGDAARALRRLETARTALAAGALVQEHEALTIEALQRTGNTRAAVERAQAFLRAYPGSPHAATVARFAGGSVGP